MDCPRCKKRTYFWGEKEDTPDKEFVALCRCGCWWITTCGEAKVFLETIDGFVQMGEVSWGQGNRDVRS
jgi:hypothetical protein